jgi:hypothetical protein
MTTKTYSLRLEGLDVPDGEISFRDLSGIGEALQLMATRIARQISGYEGRGGTRATLERMSEIRLTGVAKGSTALLMRLGDPDALPYIEGGEEELLNERFEDGLEAIAANTPPEWASPLVKESIGRVAARVQASGARRATTSWGFADKLEPNVVIELVAVDLAVWKVEEEIETHRVQMTGRLDKVDLRARKFRVRDDVGNDVTLEDVADIDAAATLIGQRVVATGVAERENGRVVRIVEPSIAAEDLPANWFEVPASVVPIGLPIPKGGISGISTTDVEEFLEEMRR